MDPHSESHIIDYMPAYYIVAVYNPSAGAAADAVPTILWTPHNPTPQVQSAFVPMNDITPSRFGAPRGVATPSMSLNNVSHQSVMLPRPHRTVAWPFREYFVRKGYKFVAFVGDGDKADTVYYQYTCSHRAAGTCSAPPGQGIFRAWKSFGPTKKSTGLKKISEKALIHDCRYHSHEVTPEDLAEYKRITK